MMDHDIIIASEVDVPEGMEEQLRKVILAALAAQGVDQGCEINVMLTDDGGIRRVNQAMRGVDAATDVLSFPMLDFAQPGDFSGAEEEVSDAFDPESGELLLGDIVISKEKVIAQAEEYGHSVKREYAFLIAHSVLHLSGYDHMEEEERIEMETLQREILNELNILR